VAKREILWFLPTVKCTVWYTGWCDEVQVRQSSGPRGRFWLPVLLFAAFVLLNLGGWWYYQNTQTSLVNAVGDRLLEASRLVAGRLDPQQLALAAADDPDGIIHLDTTLQRARNSGEFASLFVLTTTGREWLGSFADSLTGEADAVAGAAGGAFDSATVGTPAVSTIYRSRNDYFLSACVPVFDVDFTVLAVVVAEAGNEYFNPLDRLRQGLLLLDAFAGLLLLSIGLIWAGVQKRLERAEQAALRSAQLAAMGQMVATVAHELKNPLGIIKNTAERLRRKYDPGAEPLFDFIPEEVDRLDQLLHRYLQFARLEIGSLEGIELLPFAAKLEDQMNLAEGGSERLTIRIPDGLKVLADPAALRQVLLNLLLNSVEACRKKAGGEVSFRAVRKGSAVEIVVADTGVGMDPETLRRAAEPFFTTRDDGSGLGIYLAQRLTEKMNGKMSLQSRAGDGTTVVLTLPACTVD
jgi:signal transduction histidine kinase